MSDKVHSWEDMANLTHKTQVEEFNWCSCEEQEYFPYDDCPRTGEQYGVWKVLGMCYGNEWRQPN